jgi:hypothetical protein
MEMSRRAAVRRISVTAAAVIVLATIAFGYLHSPYSGVPFTHKWRKSRQCEAYAHKSGGVFTSGSSEPIETVNFFSEALSTCIQAQTFSPNNYSIVDLSKDYSDASWLLVCGPQGLYIGGKWIEEGMRTGRPCERLFKETLGKLQ